MNAHTALREGSLLLSSLLSPPEQNSEISFAIEAHGNAIVLRLVSNDDTNRLTRARVIALTAALETLTQQHPTRLVIAGNPHFFSAGADLHEIATLHSAEAFRFAQMGQRLMQAVADFPAPTIAAIHGY